MKETTEKKPTTKKKVEKTCNNNYDITKLSLKEMLELKDIVDDACEELSGVLTNYAIINNDAYFKNLPQELVVENEKRNSYKKLSGKLRVLINQTLDLYVENN